ncbi:MAG TPA: hypothetical protein VKV17_06300 [Bryobacteraceae bacterium]|nr:hypothetical protein [Bryobacteraceae bacterium]
MKKKKHSEEKIIAAVKQLEAGRSAKELVAGKILDVVGIGQHHFEISPRQVPDGLPIYPGGFHADVGDLTGIQPKLQPLQFFPSDSRTSS